MSTVFVSGGTAEKQLAQIFRTRYELPIGWWVGKVEADVRLQLCEHDRLAGLAAASANRPWRPCAGWRIRAGKFMRHSAGRWGSYKLDSPGRLSAYRFQSDLSSPGLGDASGTVAGAAARVRVWRVCGYHTATTISIRPSSQTDRARSEGHLNRQRTKSRIGFPDRINRLGYERR